MLCKVRLVRRHERAVVTWMAPARHTRLLVLAPSRPTAELFEALGTFEYTPRVFGLDVFFEVTIMDKGSWAQAAAETFCLKHHSPLFVIIQWSKQYNDYGIFPASVGIV
jgi:hypothetical protein